MKDLIQLGLIGCGGLGRVHAECVRRIDAAKFIAFCDINESAADQTVNVVYSEGGKLNALPYKKVDDSDKVARGLWLGGKDWTGIEDRYFAAVFLPDSNSLMYV